MILGNRFNKLLKLILKYDKDNCNIIMSLIKSFPTQLYLEITLYEKTPFKKTNFLYVDNTIYSYEIGNNILILGKTILDKEEGDVSFELVLNTKDNEVSFTKTTIVNGNIINIEVLYKLINLPLVQIFQIFNSNNYKEEYKSEIKLVRKK